MTKTSRKIHMLTDASAASNACAGIYPTPPLERTVGTVAARHGAPTKEDRIGELAPVLLGLVL